MAKAKLPELKWVKADSHSGGWSAGRFSVWKTGHKRWVVYMDRYVRPHLGFGCTVTEAKAIAQAFADSETLRGEGG